MSHAASGSWSSNLHSLMFGSFYRNWLTASSSWASHIRPAQYRGAPIHSVQSIHVQRTYQCHKELLFQLLWDYTSLLHGGTCPSPLLLEQNHHPSAPDPLRKAHQNRILDPNHSWIAHGSLEQSLPGSCKPFQRLLPNSWNSAPPKPVAKNTNQAQSSTNHPMESCGHGSSQNDCQISAAYMALPVARSGRHGKRAQTNC